MTPDPVVEEVRAVRDEIAREHGYDIDALFRMLQELERASGVTHVSLPPRAILPSPTTLGSGKAAQPDIAAGAPPSVGPPPAAVPRSGARS